MHFILSLIHHLYVYSSTYQLLLKLTIELDTAGVDGRHRMGDIGRVHSAPPAVRRGDSYHHSHSHHSYPVSPPPAYEEVLKQPRLPPPSYEEAQRSASEERAGAGGPGGARRAGCSSARPGRGGRGLSRTAAQDIPDIYWEQAARELDFCTCRKCQVGSVSQTESRQPNILF